MQIGSMGKYVLVLEARGRGLEIRSKTKMLFLGLRWCKCFGAPRICLCIYAYICISIHTYDGANMYIPVTGVPVRLRVSSLSIVAELCSLLSLAAWREA